MHEVLLSGGTYRELACCARLALAAVINFTALGASRRRYGPCSNSDAVAVIDAPRSLRVFCLEFLVVEWSMGKYEGTPDGDRGRSIPVSWGADVEMIRKLSTLDGD